MAASSFMPRAESSNKYLWASGLHAEPLIFGIGRLPASNMTFSLIDIKNGPHTGSQAGIQHEEALRNILMYG